MNDTSSVKLCPSSSCCGSTFTPAQRERTMGAAVVCTCTIMELAKPNIRIPIKAPCFTSKRAKREENNA